MSKDSHFRQLAFLHGPPPKAIWIRLGNSTTDHIASVLGHHRNEIEAFVASPDEALLIIE